MATLTGQAREWLVVLGDARRQQLTAAGLEHTRGVLTLREQ
ncbi:MAG TPA: hypothetical protein VK784_14160 [Pseudonocardiaceae bacterium]|nr:hypothetical protein [Pseudonocardiaceae bacterium]